MYDLLIEQVFTVMSKLLQYQAWVQVELNQAGCQTDGFIYDCTEKAIHPM